MKKLMKRPLSLTLGGTLISGFTPAALQAADALTEPDSNPFAITELTDGYMLTAKSDSGKNSKMKDGSCGEGKCGSAMMKGAEEKTAEGNCAGNKPMPKMKKSMNMKSMKNMEGKCGEGKCGSSM